MTLDPSVPDPLPDFSGPLNRRRSDFDLHELICNVHRLDTRVSVLETRMGVQDGRLASIEAKLADANDGVQKVLDVLAAHVKEESADRLKLLGLIIATLLSILGFAGAALVNHLLR